MHYFQAVTVAVLALAQFSTALPSSHKQQKRAISSLLNGSPIGFASATTGGGDADPVYPTTIQELTEYLTSTEPQVVVISGTFDFTGSEGTMTAQACNAYSCTPDNGGQSLLDTVNGCGGDTFEVTLDKAGYQPLWIQSDKTLIGTGGATIKGKGFRLSGVENIIFQNFAITDLNPQYVWGGDAIALTGTKNIWIDHIHTKSLGRQHYSFGQGASSGVTISNSFIDGETEYSASCDGHTYWGLELVGEADQITFYKNYVYMTSGRTPALSGTTFFHAVNNVWSSNSGHMIEGTDNGMGVYEGNYIVDCPNVVGDPAPSVTLFTSEAADVSKCAATMGRDCVPNELFNSGDFNGLGSSSDILSQFSGLTIIDADPVSSIKSAVVSAAGNTLDVNASTGTKVITSPAAVVSSAAADVASSTPTAVVKPVASSGVSSTAAVAMYGQCGGSMYTGSTTCAEGSTCTTYNDFYSQCV